MLVPEAAARDNKEGVSPRAGVEGSNYFQALAEEDQEENYEAGFTRPAAN